MEIRSATVTRLVIKRAEGFREPVKGLMNRLGVDVQFSIDVITGQSVHRTAKRKSFSNPSSWCTCTGSCRPLSSAALVANHRKHRANRLTDHFA